VSEHTRVSYVASADHVKRLLADEDTVTRCREVAERELSLTTVGRYPRYRELYGDVATGRGLRRLPSHPMRTEALGQPDRAHSRERDHERPRRNRVTRFPREYEVRACQICRPYEQRPCA
jgi:hypothetical protein